MITIDGPAGVGKSTVSKCLADRLHYGYLDTGALYRAIAWKVQQENVQPDDLSEIELLLSRTNLLLIADHSSFSISIDGQPVIPKDLRTSAISKLASGIAVLPVVREWLLPIQQEAGKVGGVVAEGRDMGTRVFPNADFKFFFEADVDVRALRRQQELAEKGQHISLDTVRDEMVERDTRDRTRELDPLVQAPGAIMVETSKKSVDEVVDDIMGVIADRL